MDFLQSQETLTATEWILRAVIAYVFLLITAKALGQRAISQLRSLDFVIALVIGNIIAHPLSDEHLGMKGSIITTIVLVVLYISSVFIILKFPSIRRLTNPAPVIIVKNGEIIYQGLKKAKISIDILLEELREQKADDIKKVALALWEADGKFSVFLYPEYEAVTPSQMKIATELFDFPRIIIKEGKVNYDELRQINKNEEWVVSSLKNSYNKGPKDVLLGTVDQKGNLNISLYN